MNTTMTHTSNNALAAAQCLPPSRYFGSRSSGVPDSPDVASPFTVFGAPAICIGVPLLTATAGWLSWWWAVPLAIAAAPVYFLTYIVIGEWVAPALTKHRKAPPLAPAVDDPWNPELAAQYQMVQDGDMTGRYVRQTADLPKLVRRDQPKNPTIDQLTAPPREPGATWWQRKRATAEQLANLPEPWRAFVKAAEHDHVVSGPGGVFSVQDIVCDNVAVLPTRRPAADVPAMFNTRGATPLLRMQATAPQWVGRTPTTDAWNPWATLNGWPHQTASCTLANSYNEEPVEETTVIPSSVIDTHLSKSVVAAGVNPDKYGIVLVAHGATMSTPWEYVELKESPTAVAFGGAWLVHPNRLTEFFTSQPERSTRPADLALLTRIAKRA